MRLLCRVLKASPSGYFALRRRPRSSRAQEVAWLWPQIAKVHDDSHGIYGYRRVHQALIKLAIKANQRRVTRLMSQHGRRGRQFRRYVVTTKPGKRTGYCGLIVADEFESPSFEREKMPSVA